MPNYVRNILRINGENIQAVCDFVRSDNSVFDFEKIKPIPQTCANSYHWCMENWGTKWNAVDAFLSNIEYNFDTAWSAPIPVIQKLSRLFPNNTFTLIWADEDAGENCGEIRFIKGFEYFWFYHGTAEEISEIYKECWGVPPFDEEDFLNAEID